MIVIRAELWKGGDSTKRENLGLITIANIGGTQTRGDYEFTIFKRGSQVIRWKQGTVAGFKRTKYQVWYLLFGVLRSAFGKELEKAFDAKPNRTTPKNAAAPQRTIAGRIVRGLARRRNSDSQRNLASRLSSTVRR